MNSNEATFTIADGNMARFTAEITRLVKRAEKIGVPAPTWASGERVEVKDPNTGFVTVSYLVSVSGKSPKYDGWSFVAAIDLDRENPDSPNVVHVLPGYEKDPEWSTMSERCDECNITNKGRKKLVVVQHDDGRRMVVGSTCLHDFLGDKSPQAIAAWAEMLSSFLNSGDRFEQGDYSSAGEFRIDAETYLAWVVRSIAERGWTPRSKAGDGNLATADDALVDLNAFVNGDRTVKQPMAKDFGEAAAVLAWAQDIELGSSDFLDNAAAVAQKSTWRRQDLGIGASLVSVYRRNQNVERTAEVTANSDPSEYVGVIDQRLTFHDVRVLSVSEQPSDWGVKYLVKMITPHGNRLTWWATSTIPEVDAIICGKATIKKHSEFRGVKETTVTRFSWSDLED